ncbi:3567_t:CDS:2, partial [Diversispora eburnea]
YTQTIPYFQCTYDVRDCTEKCTAADQTCIDAGATSSASSSTTGNILTAAAALPTPTINGGQLQNYPEIQKLMLSANFEPDFRNKERDVPKTIRKI